MSAVGARFALLRSRLLALAERRLPALTRLRVAECLPIRLHRRRIYVLPTAFGAAFALLLIIMQLGALNYANNSALLLTCFLAAAAWISLFAGFRGLAGLELAAISAEDCHAGNPLQLKFQFAPSGRPRPSLRMRIGDANIDFALEARQRCPVILHLPATRRGWMRTGRIRIWTEQPLGLFVVWSWINPDVPILVYPSCEDSAPPLPAGASAHGERIHSGDGEEFSGLRDYRNGDPQRRIAWKASARHDGLLVRESEATADDHRVLVYADLQGLDHESRISRLTAWVLAAESAMMSYVLQLPGQRLGPGLGSLHRHACLRALALLPDAA